MGCLWMWYRWKAGLNGYEVTLWKFSPPAVQYFQVIIYVTAGTLPLEWTKYYMCMFTDPMHALAAKL